jgi:hypothetical protein
MNNQSRSGGLMRDAIASVMGKRKKISPIKKITIHGE